MSNWFESNPLRAIIIHTIVVGGAVWTAFVFVFDENKVAVHKAEAQNYRAKTEVLEVEISRLKEENKKYLEWLTATPNTIPYLEARLKASSEEMDRLKSQLSANGRASSQSSGNLSTELYAVSETISVGSSFLDAKTTALVGLSKVTVEKTASLTLTLPGTPTRELTEVKPGAVWMFSYAKKNYRLALQRVNWYKNEITVSINEISDKN